MAGQLKVFWQVNAALAFPQGAKSCDGDGGVPP
jgi:hypothetical protein